MNLTALFLVTGYPFRKYLDRLPQGTGMVKMTLNQGITWRMPKDSADSKNLSLALTFLITSFAIASSRSFFIYTHIEKTVTKQYIQEDVT